MRQRNTYQGNSVVPWQKTKISLEDHGNIVGSVGPLNGLPGNTQGTGSHACEIVDTSRIKARRMVDDALQVKAFWSNKNLNPRFVSWHMCKAKS